MESAAAKCWQHTTLGSVIELNYGKPLPAKVRDGAMFPVFGSNGEVGKHSFPLVEKPGLIIGRKGSFGEVHISKEPFFPIDTTYYVDSFHGQPIRYWLYQLRYLPLKQLNRATAIPGLNREDAYSQVIALPALAEQKVIAQKLDTLLAQVEKTKAHLERITQILKCFRQSVLSEAVAGRLTEEWRKENFPKLSSEEFNKEIKQYRFEKWIYEQEEKFEAKGKRPVNKTWKEKYTEAKIDEKIVRRELPQGWIYQPLDGLIYISARVGWKGLKASEYTNDGPLFLSVHSLNYGRTVELSEAFHISHERYNESPEIILKNDDILLCKDGAGIGKIGIVKDLDHPATINSSLLLIRPGKYFVPEYLYFFLAGPSMQRIVQERMTGSAVPHLFQRDVKEFVLEIPPLEEQTEIVKRVEELFAFADNIDQKANTALGRVNNLTHTILAKAFRGELTAEWRTENLDLISGVNSAEALLAKIKAERETLKKQPKPKRNVRGKRIGSSMSKQIIKVTEALKQAGTSLSGQQLLEAAGYPSDSNIEELEKFFLDIREALSRDKSIVKIERSEDGQDWFSLAEADTNE
ncbi:restriction endonuclease [Halomonas sp. MG34]|nr:restriction endonuclease [Halomonas sp. MG34]